MYVSIIHRANSARAQNDRATCMSWLLSGCDVTGCANRFLDDYVFVNWFRACSLSFRTNGWKTAPAIFAHSKYSSNLRMRRVWGKKPMVLLKRIDIDSIKRIRILHFAVKRKIQLCDTLLPCFGNSTYMTSSVGVPVGDRYPENILVRIIFRKSANKPTYACK